MTETPKPALSATGAGLLGLLRAYRPDLAPHDRELHRDGPVDDAAVLTAARYVLESDADVRRMLAREHPAPTDDTSTESWLHDTLKAVRRQPSPVETVAMQPDGGSAVPVAGDVVDAHILDAIEARVRDVLQRSGVPGPERGVDVFAEVDDTVIWAGKVVDVLLGYRQREEARIAKEVNPWSTDVPF